MSLGTKVIRKYSSGSSGDEPLRDFKAASIVRTNSYPSMISSREDSIVKMPDEQVNELSLRAVDPVGLSIQDLTLEIDTTPSGIAKVAASFRKKKKQADLETPHLKRILNNVSMEIPSGSLTAILGASGSGKTSLLNILANRMSGNRLKKDGTVLYNSSPKLSSIRSAYVMQQDVLLPTLTLRETLQYSAELRLPPPVTPEERTSIVEEILLELGLKECANTRIGNNERKGCSGGEKRRASLGVQLLANPSVLFLDEVTTGLDATSALQLVQTLKQLARKGRTVIVTLHQPRSEIWGLFDHLILLTGGSPIYSGPTESCLGHFEKQGHVLPPFVNPAEFLVELAAVDTRSAELESTSIARVQRLVEAWKNFFEDTIQEKPNPIPHLSTASKMRQASFYRQLRVQTLRTLKTSWRDPIGMSGGLVEATFMGVVTGWIFLHLDGSLSGIRSREGALYTAAAFQGFLILVFETYRLTLDVPIFDREHAEGVVGAMSFLLSRRLARVLVEDLPIPLIYSVIFYFMAGFRHEAAQFGTFFALVLLSQYLSVSFAMLCVSLSRNFAGASLIANLNFTVQTLCSGFFVQSNQIPVYVRWLKYVSYVWYVNGALSSNEFLSHTSDPAGQLYDCPSPGGTSNPECKEYTGIFIINALGFPTDWVWKPFVIILSLITAFYACAGLVFKFKKIDIEISRARKPQLENIKPLEQVSSRQLENARSIDIILDKCSLDVKKRSLTKSTTKSILKPISTKFEPGMLNVVMGPSGSGKTSLLNLMAHRTHNSIATQYITEGEMLYRGAVPSVDVVRSIASYVCQDDDALLPTLTVRETLQFAAGLRLPPWMSKDEKKQKAESVLLKLGLRDCADNLIGNDLIKGISGGEKRRVTIGVQILTDPRILLLDEPTSGLDAFTASSIIDCLTILAQEGRTVVLTIHQPSSHLFHAFGTILLLARGGYPVYTGPGLSLLPHFARLGFPCSPATNPADFALDLVTINLQQADREAATRARVERLVAQWRLIETAAHKVSGSSQIAAPAELGSMKRDVTPFNTAFPLLLMRSALNFRRDRNAVIARTTQVLGFAVFLALFLAPLKTDYESVQSRFGFIQEFVAIYFVGMLQNVAVYPGEKKVFYREYEDNAYSIEAFFLQYTLLEIPFELLTSLFLGLLGDLAIGLPRTPTMFFVVVYTCFCIVNCGESLGIMFNTLVPHSDFAVTLTSAIISIATIMAGVVSLDVPPFLQAWNKISPLRWALEALAGFAMEGVVFTCEVGQRDGQGECPVSSGEQALSLYRLDGDRGLDLLAVGVCALAYRGLSYLLLKAVKGRWGWRGLS